MGSVVQTVSRLRERLIEKDQPQLAAEVLYHHYREAAGFPHASHATLNHLLHHAVAARDLASAVRVLLLLSCKAVSANDTSGSLKQLRRARDLADQTQDSFLSILCRIYAGITLHHGCLTRAAAENDSKLLELVEREGSDDLLYRVSPFLGVSCDLTQDAWPRFFSEFERQRGLDHRVAALPRLTAAWISLADGDKSEARKHTAEAHMDLLNKSKTPNVNVLDLAAAIAAAEGDASFAASFYWQSTKLRGERERSGLEQRRTASVREVLSLHPVADAPNNTATELDVSEWLNLPP